MVSVSQNTGHVEPAPAIAGSGEIEHPCWTGVTTDSEKVLPDCWVVEQCFRKEIFPFLKDMYGYRHVFFP